MLRIVSQQSDRVAVGGLDRKDGKARINRARGPRDIRAFVTGVHVGAHGGISEGIIEDSVRAANPTAVERVLPVIHGGPTDARWRQMLVGADDRLGNARDQEAGVVGVLAAAETS